MDQGSSTPVTFLSEYRRLTDDEAGGPDDEQDWYALTQDATHKFGKIAEFIETLDQDPEIGNGPYKNRRIAEFVREQLRAQ